MNLLNNIILEGQIDNDPYILEEKEIIRFTVKTERFYLTEEGERATETNRFFCEGYRPFTDAKFVKLLKKDRNIRIVGRLKQYTDCEVPYVVIVCEHLEFRK